MKEKTLLVQMEGKEPVVVTVNLENVPSGMDYHTVVERWVTSTYDFPKYDYWEIDSIQKHNI